MNVTQALDSVIEYLRQGNLQRAKGICRKILRQKPNDPDALHLLGMIYSESGEYDQAVTHIQKALQADPHFAEAYNNLGNIFRKTKRLDKALENYQKAVSLNPTLSEIFLNMGIVLQDLGNTDEAIASYHRVIEIRPDHFGAYNNLGLALQEEGNTDEAISCYRQAIQINPRFADAHNNLANTLKNKGQRDDAKSSYQQAIAINPDFAEAFNNLGILLKEEGYLDDAIACYMRALEIKSDYVEAYSNLGAAYHAKGALGRAFSYYQKAIMIDSRYADAYNNLGNAFKDAGNLVKAESYFKLALEIKSDSSVAFSNLLFTQHYDDTKSPEDVFSGHLKFAEHFEKPLIVNRIRTLNKAVTDRKLRIGYVSPDFRTHSVAYFLEPALAAHNHNDFEIFCYSDVIVPDSITNRIQGHTDSWLNIVGKSDEDVYNLVQEHQIDILVDLSGHTGNNRMLVFARKPAPVQLTWIGYPATTGLSAMDYKIVDSYTDPPGLTDHLYTEKLLRMPECFLCYLPPADSPDIIIDPPVPSEGHIHFGSFNNFSKVSPATVDMWARILQSVPDAVLVLKARCFADEQMRRYAEEMFSIRNIDADRIELLSWVPSTHPHLDLYNRIDIALDTFPYNGTTTTCEALWMGVPVITLAGKAHASRVGASLLSNIGYQELVALTVEEYIDIAVRLAKDREKLRFLHATLRDNMAQSPLTAAKQFTANLEICYRKIWKQWCAEA